MYLFYNSEKETSGSVSDSWINGSNESILISESKKYSVLVNSTSAVQFPNEWISVNESVLF